MKKPLFIVKLGGSVITDKNKNKGVFRKAITQRLAKEIATARKMEDVDLILVHGAGSFGHPIAKKYKLDKGYLDPDSIRGFVLCKKATLELSNLVLDSLLKAGLNTSVVIPGNVIKTKGGKIKKFETEIIENLLDKSIVPILFGDMVFDDDDGFAVLSGDAIVTYLARKLGAKKVIFVSDVDGVYDKNPKVYKDAKLMAKITSKNYREIIDDVAVFNKNDVSGEMRGKLENIRQGLADTEVLIINGFLKGNILKSFANNTISMAGTAIFFGGRHNA